MRKILYVFAFIILLCAGLFGAANELLEYYFEHEQFDLLKSSVRSLPARQKNNPEVLFYTAFTCSAPDSALLLYERIASKHPSSKYADQALYRLGQYYYFAADYPKSRQYFSKLLHGYPHSFLKDDAQYLYCQCILAQGKSDSAKIFLKAFVQNVRRSPHVDSAILDLESLGGVSTAQPQVSANTDPKIFFSIHVASFKSFESAKNAMFKLAKVYPHVEVGERRLGNTDYFLVYLGRFDSHEKAQQYATLYIEPHLQDYKITRRSR